MAGSDGFLRIFDYSDFNLLLFFKIETGGIVKFTLTSNCMIIVIACEDGSVILLHLLTFYYIRILGHTSFLTDVKIIPLNEIIE